MRLIVILGILFIPYLSFTQARRAQSQIEKGKLEDAYERLNRALVKDSLAAAEKYVLASLFFDSGFANYDLDSAYHYILQALDAYEQTDYKEQLKQVDQGFSLSNFIELKKEIEAVGFRRAKSGGGEQDYIDYIAEFSSASQIDSAIFFRNELAFFSAKKKDTYQAYKHFFNTYPEAIEVGEARKRYEKLLFEKKTSNKKLNSYQQFLQEYPRTWHRKEAEQVIYNIITGRNNIDSYAEFIQQYPQSFLKSQALLAKYGLMDKQQQTTFLKEKWLSQKQIDSIYNISNLAKELIIPIINNGEYQLINIRGDVVLDHLTNISDLNKCAVDSSSIILATVGNENELIALNGYVLANGDIASFTNYGQGIIKISTQNDEYFINAGGFRTNNSSFKEAIRVGPYIAFKRKNRWGLESITGIPMLEPRYDSILSFQGQIILNRGRKWGIFNKEHFYPLLDKDQVEINLAFDQISVINNEYVYLVVGKKSSLISASGEILIPLELQSIELVDGGYYVDRIDSVLDSRVSESWYKDISLNQDWIIGTRSSDREIYFKSKLLLTVVEATTIGSTAIRIYDGDSTFFYFNSETRITLGEEDIILPINKMGNNSSARHFVYSNTNDEILVYDGEGKIIEVGEFDRLIDLGDDYILNFNNNNYHLLYNDGEVLVTEIDGATSLGNGYISYVVDRKFGLFNLRDSTNIEPHYDRPLATYTNGLFVVSENSKYGIINRYDSLLVPLMYDNIQYLNDTIAILTNNFRQLFWNIPQSKMLVDNISNYWLQDDVNHQIFKIFRGIGYGIWTPESGIVLNSTFSEINIVAKGDDVVFIAEKWVEEADIVIMLYYDSSGKLFRKEVISIAEYEDLACKSDDD